MVAIGESGMADGPNGGDASAVLGGVATVYREMYSGWVLLGWGSSVERKDSA